MAKVSIILTSYNKPDMVGESIESVLNQTHPDWELFIMDDQSNEITASVIHRYADDPRIAIFFSGVKDEDRYKRTRYAYLINLALAQASGEYVSYLTDDTEYKPDRLKKMISYFESHPEAQIVYSSQQIEQYNSSGKKIWTMLLEAKEVFTRAANRVDHCSVMHTKEIAEKVFSRHGSYWDDNPLYWYNADAVFWTRMNDFAPFYPILEVLDVTKNTPKCYQLLKELLPEDIPNGFVIKGLTSDLFLMEEGKRRPISKKMFKQLQYERVIEVPDPNLFKYTIGREVDWSHLPNQVLLQSIEKDNYYILQKGKKRPVSKDAMQKYGFSRKRAVEMVEEELEKFSLGPLLTAIIQEDDLLPEGILFVHQQRYYLSQDNKLCFFQTDVAARKFFLCLDDAISLNDKEFSFFQQGPAFTWELPFK